MKELAKDPSVLMGLALGAFLSTLNIVTALVIILILGVAIIFATIRKGVSPRKPITERDYKVKATPEDEQ